MASVVLATPDSLSSSITPPMIPSGPLSLSSIHLVITGCIFYFTCLRKTYWTDGLLGFVTE